MESTVSDKPLSKLSPFALQKGIQGLVGVLKDVNGLRSGQVLIKVDCKKPLLKFTQVKHDCGCANKDLST